MHEAFVRLEDRNHACRQHFFGAAATAMRNLLTDYARARRAEKRGAGRQRVTFVPAAKGTRCTHTPACHDHGR